MAGFTCWISEDRGHVQESGCTRGCCCSYGGKIVEIALEDFDVGVFG